MAEKSNKVLLQVKGLKVAYGGIQAVKGVDMEVREGELVTLIGSNGAGKTTTMKAITGTLGMNDGDIEYLGESIKGKGAWDLVKKGLVMVPEGRGVLARMTITENLQMGAYIRKDKAGILSEILTIFANCGANILTINQSIPTGGRAMVTISAETSNLNCNIEALTQQIAERTGVVKADCVAG